MHYRTVLKVQVILCSAYAFSQVLANTRWTSFVLQNLSTTQVHSEKAIGIVQESGGQFIVAVDRSPLTPVLYKTDEFGNILWALQSRRMRGTFFNLALDRLRGIAYGIISSPSQQNDGYSDGHVLRYMNVSSQVSQMNANDMINEEVIYSTNSSAGNTKLFGSTVDPSNGDLILTGGTSGSLYGAAIGKSDVVVVRVTSEGVLLASRQFGTEDDEFGRAVSISSDSKAIVIAVQRSNGAAQVESVLYRLDAYTLEEIEPELTLRSYETTALFTPSDIAVSAPLVSEPNTTTTVIAGTALIVPDRKLDLFLHIFAKIGDADSNVPVYVDGARDGKQDDFGVGVKCGPDGNIYSLGYSNADNSVGAKSVIVTVVSPSGKLLQTIEKTQTNEFSSREVPTAMELMSINSRVVVVYVGYTDEADRRQAVLGFAAPPLGSVPAFSGFGGIVEEAGAGSFVDVPGKEQVQKGLEWATLMGIIGGAVFVVGVLLAIVCVYQKGRKAAKRTSPVVIESPRALSPNGARARGAGGPSSHASNAPARPHYNTLV